MDERWIRVLSYWQEHELRHALTFPFLVGALRTPVGAKTGFGDDARRELEALVDAMRSHRANGYVHHVYRCPDRRQLVVTKVIGSSPPPYAVPIRTGQAGAAPSLYASNGVPANTTAPFASLVATIWNEGGSAIECGHFSCRGTLFAAFNQDEFRIIRAALA